MYERSISETEKILATHKDVVVPVKEVWLEVSKQGQLQRFEVPPLANFTTLLEADERFEFLPAGEELGDNYVEPVEEDEPEYATDIERLGFYSEDRVRLRNIESLDDVEEEVTEATERRVLEPESDEQRSGRRLGEKTITNNRAGANGTPPAKVQEQSANHAKASHAKAKTAAKGKKKVKSKK